PRAVGPARAAGGLPTGDRAPTFLAPLAPRDERVDGRPGEDREVAPLHRPPAPREGAGAPGSDLRMIAEHQERLIQDVLEGEASPAQAAELKRLLETSSGVRARYEELGEVFRLLS